jgi:predicted GIY-YIG superfamily endonuclease
MKTWDEKTIQEKYQELIDEETKHRSMTNGGIVKIEKEKPTTLYRLFKDKHLLYVGISCNFISRFNAHKNDKNWWIEVNRIETEHFESRERALIAEQNAIKVEKPLFNVVHNKENTNSESTPDFKDVPKQEFATKSHSGDIQLASDEFFMIGSQMVARLWLYPEINYSSILCDYFDEELAEDEAFNIVCDQVKKNCPWEWENDAVGIFWSVCGIGRRLDSPKKILINEWAPFSEDCKNNPNMPNFLTRYGWPLNWRGEVINWMSMPVMNHRFPTFGKSLGWSPAPFQTTAPLRTLQAMKKVVKFQQNNRMGGMQDKWIDEWNLLMTTKTDS